jgi:PqqD family protein of HPr-rel-A system
MIWRGAYRRRPEGDLLCHRVGEELVVYDQKSGQVHLLAPPLARVFETAQECQADHLSADLFPELKRKTARSRLKEALEALAEQGLLLRPELPQAPGLSRREFHKKVAAAAALPAILTLVAPTPAAAQSTCGTPLTFTADDTVTVPACATRVRYSIIGGEGGGGGGGGTSSTGMSGNGGSDGDMGATVAMTTAMGSVMGGDTLTIMVGTGGAGGLAGGDAASTSSPGAGGAGGAGGTPSGNPGSVGDPGTTATSPDRAGGGGGGGGGSGGTSSISSGTLGTVSAQGGMGGMGGDGGNTGGGMGGGDGGAGGAGNNSGMGGDGGAAGMAGSAGAAGSVTITFLA